MRALFLEDRNIICENWHLNAGMMWLLLSNPTRMDLSETKCVKICVLSLNKKIYIRKIIYRLWLLKVCMHSSSKGQFGPDK